jgi:hypothetical protein
LGRSVASSAQVVVAALSRLDTELEACTSESGVRGRLLEARSRKRQRRSEERPPTGEAVRSNAGELISAL